MWDDLDLPPVLFDPDLAKLLRTSDRTVKRLKAIGALPIRQLPHIDKRSRYSRQDVVEFLERGATAIKPRR